MDNPIGWKKLINAAKWHFFDADGRSLCGKWLTLGNQGEIGMNDHPSNCIQCSRKASK